MLHKCATSSTSITYYIEGDEKIRKLCHQFHNESACYAKWGKNLRLLNTKCEMALVANVFAYKHTKHTHTDTRLKPPAAFEVEKSRCALCDRN